MHKDHNAEMEENNSITSALRFTITKKIKILMLLKHRLIN